MRTDSAGRVVWRGAYPGKLWAFLFDHTGYLQAYSSYQEARSGETLPEETVVLYRKSGVQAMLLSPQGEPLSEEGVWFKAAKEDGAWKAYGETGPNGRVRAFGELPATRVSLRIEAGGLIAEYPEVALPPNEALDLGEVVLLREGDG